MNHKLLYQWSQTIAKHLKSLNSWQIESLALFSYGAALAGSSRQINMARQVVCGEKVASTIKRLQRFLGNDKWLDDQFFIEWSRWILSILPSRRVYLLVDETKLADKHGAMFIGLAFECRCLPLVWQSYKANSREDYPPEGQVDMIVAMLRLIQQAMPDGKYAIVMADRGIGGSSDLCRKVDKLGLRFLFRINKQSKMVVDGEELLIYEQVKPGGEWAASGQVFKNNASLPAHVRALWRRKYTSPWLLITNDEQLSGYEYGQRNHQEQSFRDMKSGGLHWGITRVSCPQRMRRLIAILVLAYAWMISLGCHAVEQGYASPLIGRGENKRRKWSLFLEGMAFLCEQVVRKGLWFPFDLFADKRFT